MKKHTLIMLLALTLFACDKDDPPVRTIECLSDDLQNGVIAFYPFSNGSIDDESGNGNHLTNPGGAIPTNDRNGNADCAYRFDNLSGADEFLTTTATTFLDNLDEFSISLWYEPLDSSRAGGIYETLIGRDDGAKCPNRRGEWSLGLYDCRRAVFGHENSVWAEAVTGFSDGCEGEVWALTKKWHHVVAIKDGDTFSIYFNGNLEETNTGPAICGNPISVMDIGDLLIGKRYTGRLDDILIYDRALSQMEVNDLWNLETCCK